MLIWSPNSWITRCRMVIFFLYNEYYGCYLTSLTTYTEAPHFYWCCFCNLAVSSLSLFLNGSHIVFYSFFFWGNNVIYRLTETNSMANIRRCHVHTLSLPVSCRNTPRPCEPKDTFTYVISGRNLYVYVITENRFNASV